MILHWETKLLVAGNREYKLYTIVSEVSSFVGNPVYTPFFLYKDKGLIIKIQSRKRGSADQGYFKGLLFLN